MGEFEFYECPECGFSSVQRLDFNGSKACPMCAGDSGHDVRLSCRPATDSDRPEGFDARKGTRQEQTAAFIAQSPSPPKGGSIPPSDSGGE